MDAVSVVEKPLHVAVQLVDGDLSIDAGDGLHPVSGMLDGRTLKHVDVPRIGRDDQLVTRDVAVDDRQIGLRAAIEEKDVGIGSTASLTDFLFGRQRPFIKTIGETLLSVGLSQMLKHQRMGAIVVIALERNHSYKF